MYQRPAHVLFFAAVPPPEIRDRIAEVWQRQDVDARFRGELLHLSVQAAAAVDEVPQALVDVLRRVGADTRGLAFELSFDRVETFGSGPGPRPIVLSTDRQGRGANELSIALRKEMSRLGLPGVTARKVEPHVTMAYADVPPNAVKLLQPIRWRVESFTLIDSVQGKGRHIPLGTWALGEQGDDDDRQGSLF